MKNIQDEKKLYGANIENYVDDFYFEKGDLLTKDEVLELLKIKKSTLYDGMKKGIYPRPINIGGRKWLRKEIVKVIKNAIKDRNKKAS
ncbi:AlpA family phage regulatory protein [Deferribacteraceae bacterium V6Fe1]|nr:AlpA family phage regulatory protein [Deferribacteraceae bacterium V6Fe1]